MLCQVYAFSGVGWQIYLAVKSLIPQHLRAPDWCHGVSARKRVGLIRSNLVEGKVRQFLRAAAGV